MKSRMRFAVIGLVIVAALGVWQLLTGDTLFRQRRNMKKADEHVPIVRQKLDAVPDFRHLHVAHYTDAGGSLIVHGEVRSEDDVKRVKEIVAQTTPPVTVVYQLTPTNDTR
jgi:hypothetical protein